MTPTEEDPVTVVVIDDDPTGAQTLRDVPLLFGIDPSTILDGLRTSKPVLCILTNSRALSAEAAAAANHRIAGLLREAPTPPLVVSRGDSTLRGNLKAETEAIITELWPDTQVTRVFVPAFVEAGRTTLGGVHYVNVDGKPEPVGETPYARDARFGFSSSRLSDYLVEMGVVEDASDVVELHRDRYDADASAVADAIAEADDRWIVVDAVNDAEIDAIAAAIRRRHAAGQPLLVRCAPSLVRALAGQPTRPALSDDELRAHFPGRSGHGLVAVGSHVPQTTRQLAELRTLPGIHPVEVELDVLLDESDERRSALVGEIVAQLSAADVVLSTPRAELRDDSPDGALAHRFSRGFCAIVDAVARQAHPAWVIAKGGITSHDTAEIALGIRSADVVGQLFDSRVSIVRPTSAPEHVDGMPYVIFPGNVGGDEDLATAVERMRMLAE